MLFKEFVKSHIYARSPFDVIHHFLKGRLVMRFPLNILTDALLYFRGPGVCQLRRDLNSSLAEGWQRPLPLQRLRPLLQNEWYKSAPGQTKTQNGKSQFIEKSKLRIIVFF